MASRNKKIVKSYYLSQGTIDMIRQVSDRDGCSDNQTVTIAVNMLALHRSILQQLAAQPDPPKDEPGDYAELVLYCNDRMTESIRTQARGGMIRELDRMAAEIEDLLQGDELTPAERELFFRFTAWWPERKEEIRKQRQYPKTPLE